LSLGQEGGVGFVGNWFSLLDDAAGECKCPCLFRTARYDLRFNVHQVVGLLVMKVRMTEGASDSMTDGEGGQHQSSV
jgi:hypothetical protein